MKHLPIIALDFPSGQEALAFLEPFEGTPLFVKVGMELFYQEGPAILDALKEKIATFSSTSNYMTFQQRCKKQ